MRGNCFLGVPVLSEESVRFFVSSPPKKKATYPKEDVEECRTSKLRPGLSPCERSRTGLFAQKGPFVIVAPLTTYQRDRRSNKRTLFLFLFLACGVGAVGPIAAQTVSIALASGNATPGSSVPLAISMTATGGAQPSSLEWTMRYPADVTSVVVSGGPKNVTCSNFGGSTTCLMFDLTQNTIPSGAIALATVVISPGSTSTNVPISMSGLIATDATGSITYSTSASGGSLNILQQTPRVAPSAVTCNPSTVSAPESLACMVTLNGPAPAGGMTVALISNSANVTVPGSVTLSPGATAAGFTAVVTSIPANQSVTITATANGAATAANVNLVTAAPRLSGFSCFPATLGTGQSSLCTLALTQALSATAVGTLSSSTAALTVPPYVTFAAGANSGTFTVVAGTVTTSQTAALTATLNGQSISSALSLTANVSPSGVSCTGGSILIAPGTSSCTLTLTGAAPGGGITVTLSSTTPDASVPTIILVPPGAVSVGFTVTVGAIAADESATITATANGMSQAASVNLSGSPQLASVACLPAALGSGQTATCTVLLSRAPGATVTVNLSSSTGLLTIPPAIAVPGTATSATFTATAGTVSGSQTATITANWKASVTAGISLSAGLANTSLNVTGLANSASFASANACSPGSWLNIAGSGFTADPPQSGNLDTTLNGLQVMVNGAPAPLLYASNSMITFQCPMLPVGTATQVSVTTPAGSAPVPIQNTMLAATPALFTVDAARPGQGLVMIANSNSLAMPATGGFLSAPAVPGQYVSILATGLGPVSASSPPLAVNYVRVWIGGVPVQPSFAGLVPGGAGVFQVIAQIPANITAGTAVPLYLEVDPSGGNAIPSNQVVIAVSGS